MSMKKTLISLILVVVLCFSSVSVAFGATSSPAKAPAVGTTVETSKAVKVTVQKDETVSYKNNNLVSKYTVPETVKIDGQTYKVTSIEKNAFNGQTNKEVVLSKNIKTINAYAFQGDYKLKKITIKGTGSIKVNKNAFKSSKKGTAAAPVKKIKVYVSKKMSAKNFKALKKQLIAAGIQEKNIIRK